MFSLKLFIEPTHIASVLSMFAFKPEHSYKLSKINTDLSNDISSASCNNDESSLYWLRMYSESLI